MTSNMQPMLTPVIQNWYTNKNTLLKEIEKGQPLYLLSKDVEHDGGKKHFTYFKTIHHFITFLQNYQTHDPHFYEIIVDTTNYPVFLFFDIDKNIYSDDSDQNKQIDDIISTFLNILERFLKEAYDIQINLEIGQNVQIAISSTSNKLSTHVKINIICQNMYLLKELSTLLNAYILSNVHCTDEEREALIYLKTNTDMPYYESIIDNSIYTNFRSYRTLYSSKWKTNGVPLLPYQNSSPHIKDHLVNVFNEGENHIIRITSPSDFKIQADFAKKKDITVKKTFVSKILTHQEDQGHISQIPTHHIEKIKETICNSDVIKKLLQTSNFTCSSESTQPIPNIHNLYFQGYYCPYAQRVHAHNRSYFEYNIHKRRLTYRCFDQECRIHEKTHGCIAIDLNVHMDSLAPIAELKSVDTLHDKDEIIIWDETYNQAIMKPYPLHPICIIRANMGTGKTKCLVEHLLPQICKSNVNAKCLFITYQRLLSLKYLKDLEAFGFVNYMDVDSFMIQENKVIVCLDSLHRVQSSTFDFVFIDEATSVFLHFQSNHIKNSQLICLSLEVIMFRAKYVYLIDACSDNLIVYDVAKHMSKSKNVEPYCIKNTYIRPTNRTCDIIINRSRKRESIMKVELMNIIYNSVMKNEKVVLTSSTKSFAEETHRILSQKIGNQKTILLYHSESSERIDRENMDQLNQKWSSCDILIYSPTISAGVSFELPHFHLQISYVENNPFTPPVDCILQQMFRVRQLITGKMYVFIQDYTNSAENQKYPTTAQGIDEKLNQDVHNLGRYYGPLLQNYEKPLRINPLGIVDFDINKLSYKILRGILVNNNKSRNHFKTIIYKTLQQDYNIPCQIRNLQADNDDLIDRCESFMKKHKSNKMNEKIEFSRNLILRHSELDVLEKKDIRGEQLTSMEKASKICTDCIFLLWKVNPAKVDYHFYNTYISPSISKGHDEMLQKYFTFRRTHDMLMNDHTTNVNQFHDKMNSIAHLPDSTHVLYKTMLKKYHRILLEGHAFLDYILIEPDRNYKDFFKRGASLQLRNDDFHDRFVLYLKQMTDDRFTSFIQTFHAKSGIQDKEDFLFEEKKHKSKRMFLAKKIVSDAFGMSLVSHSSNHMTGSQNIMISSPYHNILKYEPELPMNTENDEHVFQFMQEEGNEVF